MVGVGAHTSDGRLLGSLVPWSPWHSGIALGGLGASGYGKITIENGHRFHKFP